MLECRETVVMHVAMHFHGLSHKWKHRVAKHNKWEHRVAKHIKIKCTVSDLIAS